MCYRKLFTGRHTGISTRHTLATETKYMLSNESRTGASDDLGVLV